MRRAAMARQTARRWASDNALQRAISSIVRKQPSQNPVRAFMRQTETQGEGTGVVAGSGWGGVDT